MDEMKATKSENSFLLPFTKATINNATALLSATLLIATMSSLLVLFTSGQVAFGHHVIEQIDVAKRPLRMSVAGDVLYVANIGEPSVSVVDTKIDKVVRSINTTDGVSALYAVPELGKLYVSIFEGGRVEVYDLKTHNLIKNITLPGSTLDLWYNPSDNYDKHVAVLTGGISMDYDNTTGMMYVAVYNHDHIEVIDTKTDTAIKTIDVPAHPFTVKVDPQTKMVLVTSLAGNRLSFISTETNAVTGDGLFTGNAPWGLDVDRIDHKAYVTHRGSFYVAVVDIPTREVIAKIPVTDVVQAVAVDTGEHKVYFSYMDKQNIVKIDGKTNQVETVIEMDAVPWDLVADSTNHKVYASTKLSDKVIAIGPRSVSSSLPVVTVETPTAILGTINVHGQDVTVSEPLMNIASKTLSMTVSTVDGGDLTLAIPRQTIDSRQGTNDTRFQVMIDGRPIDYTEGQGITTTDGTQFREISAFVPKGATKLEVIGTQVIPEFPMVMLVASLGIAGTIVYARVRSLARET
jgi:YVTN family beta-propeller protein